MTGPAREEQEIRLRTLALVLDRGVHVNEALEKAIPLSEWILTGVQKTPSSTAPQDVSVGYSFSLDTKNTTTDSDSPSSTNGNSR